uniref:Uncharacterized protein n=1 Tax=viral metagenome TaxID=1070528 RepID=A0A2V0R9I1_9ZZZZ
MKEKINVPSSNFFVGIYYHAKAGVLTCYLWLLRLKTYLLHRIKFLWLAVLHHEFREPGVLSMKSEFNGAKHVQVPISLEFVYNKGIHIRTVQVYVRPNDIPVSRHDFLSLGASILPSLLEICPEISRWKLRRVEQTIWSRSLRRMSTTMSDYTFYYLQFFTPFGKFRIMDRMVSMDIVDQSAETIHVNHIMK